MIQVLEKLLDLPRELRLGSTWLVLTTLVVGADAYVIARFDRSLLSVFGQVDALVAARPNLGAMLVEGLFAIATLVLVWFYVMPVAAFSWRQFVFWCHWHLPRSLQYEPRFPRRSVGWQWIASARIRAIEENNAVLFEACERRLAEVKARDLILRCVLATIVLSLMALVASTPSTGPSLIGAAYSWLDGLSQWHFVVLFLLTLPALAFVWAVLVDRDGEFDNDIQLRAPKSDRDRAE